MPTQISRLNQAWTSSQLMSLTLLKAKVLFVTFATKSCLPWELWLIIRGNTTLTQVNITSVTNVTTIHLNSTDWRNIKQLMIKVWEFVVTSVTSFVRLSLIYEDISSRYMKESNRLLAQNVENHTKEIGHLPCIYYVNTIFCTNTNNKKCFGVTFLPEEQSQPAWYRRCDFWEYWLLFYCFRYAGKLCQYQNWNRISL